MTEYPKVGFHFEVKFELFQDAEIDIRFQEVSGLKFDLEISEQREGGNNDNARYKVSNTTFSDLTLKRGKFITSSGSKLLNWFKDAVEKKVVKPTNIHVNLLDEEHQSLCSWYLKNAIPKSFEIGGFNAMQGGLLVETMVIKYQSMRYLE